MQTKMSKLSFVEICGAANAATLAASRALWDRVEFSGYYDRGAGVYKKACDAAFNAACDAIERGADGAAAARDAFASVLQGERAAMIAALESGEG